MNGRARHATGHSTTGRYAIDVVDGRFHRGQTSGGRDVIDQTGMTGDFDFTLALGFLPLAAIATAHPSFAGGLGTFGVHTLPAALEEQLGLRLVQTKAARDIVVIASAQRRPS